VADILSLHRDAGFVLSRMRRGDLVSLVYAETTLAHGDLVVAVGDRTALERARAIFGEESPERIYAENTEFDYRRIEVSDKRVVGKTISSLRLQELLDATVTRVRRGDTDFVPSGSTVLERGDRVRVITWAGNMERVVRFFGDSIRSATEMDLLSLSLGIMCGILLGLLPIPLPGGGTFTLGFAGGPLVAGLILGRMGRSGRIAWAMPFAVNQTLRQVGLALFLAGVGTKAGAGLIPTLWGGGWKLLLLGAVITTVLAVVTMVAGGRSLRLSFPAAMGMMSGIQTQPACLAFANERSGSNAPNVWYASVYPISMIAKIMLAQLLIVRLL
jgi:putative transport protein